MKTELSRSSRTRSTQSGVTMIEMLIATLVLSIGLVSLAQLFIVATLNNAFTVNISAGVNDAQRMIEVFRIEAASSPDGINSSLITSSSYDEGTGENSAFADLDGYDADEDRFKQYVWVFDNTGTLVGTATPSYPPDEPTNAFRSLSTNSVFVYIRMEPKFSDPRTNQTLILTAVVYDNNN